MIVFELTGQISHVLPAVVSIYIPAQLLQTAISLSDLSRLLDSYCTCPLTCTNISAEPDSCQPVRSLQTITVTWPLTCTNISAAPDSCQPVRSHQILFVTWPLTCTNISVAPDSCQPLRSLQTLTVIWPLTCINISAVSLSDLSRL